MPKAPIVLALLALPFVAAGPVHAVETPPDGFVAAYLAGYIAERRGDGDVAANRLRRALELAPETPALDRRVVRLQIAEGDFERAAAGAEKLAAAGDDNFPIGLLRLAARFKSGDYAGAAALAEAENENGISPIVALLARAWAYAGAGDVDKGAKTLTDAAKSMESLKVIFALHAGLMAEQAGRADLARWMYEESVAAAEAEDRPLSSRLVQIVASFLERNGQPDAATELREKAELTDAAIADAAAIGQVAKTPAGGLAEALYNFAGSLFGDRQFRQALIYARLSAALRPDDPSTQFTIGQVLEATGRPAAAAEAFRAVPPVGSYGWRAPMQAADSLREAGDAEAALAALRAVVESHPETSEPAISLGHMLRAESKFEEAVKAYDEAIRRKGGLGPEDGWLRYARGVALERSGDWPSAEKAFLAALETLGDEPLVLNYLGYTWIDRGEHLERARGMVARAVELRPEDGFIRDSLGWAEYRAGEYEAAAATLERAVALQPLDPIINEHLGDAYWKVGRHREARFQWRRALSFEPEETQVPILEEKLKCGVDGCPAATAPKDAEGDGG